MLKSEIQSYRKILHSIAFKIVGCTSVAEDLVQDTFLNWFKKKDVKEIVDNKAYLITSVRNLSFNYLKKKKDDLFENMGVRFISFKAQTDFSYLDIKQELTSSLSIVFRKLTPVERTVFLLKGVFNFDYAELPDIIGKTSDNCRQLFSRAQMKLTEKKERFTIDSQKLTSVVSVFKKASLGDLSELIDRLKEDLSPVPK